MSTNEEKFLKLLRATFKGEAHEHLETIAAGLQTLEKLNSPDEQQPVVETIFRAAHSLKGAARAVNFIEIESVCQALEDLFAVWKRRENSPTPHALDLANQSLDAVSTVLADPEGQPDRTLASRVQALRTESSAPSIISTPESANVEAPTEPSAPRISRVPEKTATVETVRIGVAKLDARLLEAEEMLAAKLVTSQRVADLRDLSDRLDDWKKEWLKVQPDARAIRQSLEHSASSPPQALRGLVEFVDWNHNYFRSLESKLAALNRKTAHDSQLVGKLVDDLLEDSKKLLMLPLSSLAGLFKRLVRDICRDQGKKAELVLIGDDVEIDKRILEEMKDPLIHILRNCVDHGLETPERRIELGKPAQATITLKVSSLDGDKVEIVVSDDGAGIETERVKESAVKHGVISVEEARQLSEAEALQLIFKADVSTSPIITELSGRGLGLAIVREQTEKLGGTVALQSVVHAGTTIRITLPVALRTFRGVLVETGKQLFVVPTAQVDRVSRFKAEDVRTVEGRDTLALNGRAVALTSLAEVLELDPSTQTGSRNEVTPILILGAGDHQIAFSIDAVLGEQEVLVRRLSKPLVRVRNIAGATVLGSGQIAPILNVSDLLKSAKKSAGLSMRPSLVQEARGTEAKSILVAEDSITSRMLIRGILESAGYQVKTAVDGVDALTSLKTERFDLVVSDVEMPRLNGFDLTARIRADEKLAELPIVLVTALETREDRERGIDVGANAYLVKSNFDQNNLLEAVRRLA
jgi:two-component system chemotaxis sensor kinase CheA